MKVRSVRPSAVAFCVVALGCGSEEPPPPPPAAVLAGGPGAAAVGLDRPLGPDVPLREGDPPALHVDYLSATVEGRDVLWESVVVTPGETVEVELTFRFVPNPDLRPSPHPCEKAVAFLLAWPTDGADPPARAGDYRDFTARGEFPQIGGGRYRGVVSLLTDRAFNPGGYRVDASAGGSCGNGDRTSLFDLVPAPAGP